MSPLFVERRSLEYIATFDFRPSTEFTPGFLASLEVRPTLIDQIGLRQREDTKLGGIMDLIIGGEVSRHLQRYSLDDRGYLRRDGRLCVPRVEDLLRTVLEEAHHSRMTIHPGGDKMYRDMRRVFYWSGMKKSVAEFVSKCLVCQRVKAE